MSRIEVKELTLLRCSADDIDVIIVYHSLDVSVLGIQVLVVAIPVKPSSKLFTDEIPIAVAWLKLIES